MSARWVLYTVRQPFKVILMGMAHANSFVPLSFFGEKRKQEGGDFSIVNVKLKHILRVLITCPTPCTMDLKSFCNRIYLYLVIMKKGNTKWLQVQAIIVQITYICFTKVKFYQNIFKLNDTLWEQTYQKHLTNWYFANIH